MRVGGRSVFRRARIALLLGSTALVSAAGVAVPSTQAQQQVSYRIPAGNLGPALTNWARASGVKLLASSPALSGRSTHGVSGSYEPQQALSTLLAGTGLSYNFDGATVTIIDPGQGASAGTVDGDAIMLETIDVSTQRAGAAADVPYTTSGSVNYISEQDIQRFPGSTAGDIFKSTPGVISGSNRNGAAIDPNIRGLQGMNRVATTIDGSEQATSSYRGYQGVDSRSYFDPDLISGVTITKGPDGGSAGAIGGTIAMETLKVDDILKPGESYGVRVKGSVGTNSVEPEIGSTDPRLDQPSFFNGGNGSASVALGATQENVDLVAGFVRRKNGNYFAGNHGDLTVPNYAGIEEELSEFKYGDEVFNTSQDVTSALLKSTLRPADGHELQLSYMHYDNTFGEVTPTIVGVGSTPRQVALSEIDLDQVAARYNWRPDDNELIDFKVNSWISNTNEKQNYIISNDTVPIFVRTQTYGLDVSNTSHLDMAHMPFTVSYGASFKYEDAAPRDDVDDSAGAYPVDGTRRIGTLYAKGKWELLPWLSLDAGIEYLTFKSDYRGTPEYTYSGPEYAGYDGDGFSPSFGVTVTPLEGWQLFGKYASGIRPPSIRETSWTRFDQVFNPDLKAEKARNWEFGTNFLKDDLFFEGDKARLKLAYFDNTTDDYIGRTSASYVLSFFNYDEVRFKGFELSGGYDTGRVFADFAFNYYTDFEACYVDGTCIDHTLQSDYLTNQIPPEYSVSVTAGARLLDEKLTVGGRVTYIGERLAPITEDTSYFSWITTNWAPYTLVDLFAQWKLNDNLTFDVSAENLLDRYYVDALNNTDMPAPGRTIRASLTGKFGVENTQIDIPRLGRATNGEPGSDWTGLYVGVHAGYGNNSIEGQTMTADGTTDAAATSESADQKLAGLLGGLQLGVNYQLDNRVVLGVEGDISWATLEDYRDISVTDAEGAGAVTRNLTQASMRYRTDWLATLRGRVGYAFDRLLVYGTGGLAFLQETEERTQFRTTSLAENSASFTETTDVTRQGWTLGAGAEYAIANRWSLKAEYNYAHFGEDDFLFSDARSGASAGFNVRDCSSRPCTRTPYPNLYDTVNGRKASNEAEIHTLKIGLNYRF